MTVNSPGVFQIREDLLIEEVDGEFVILDMHHNVYFGLEAMGKLIWELLQQEQGVDSIVTTIASHYGVSEDVVRRDVMTFIDQLVEQGLITTRVNRA